ncbi:polysaccharide pyruvyl transferase family protein [Streptomyces sp. NPDC057362]|uniref:polysaccharide pyruvyl transferase family protein n=1 Tax=Streptomyces sp. NPDC057362 TaxID=3346106 RepID=UPI003645393F
MTLRPSHPHPDRRGPRIGVLGSYGGFNTGDEAILTCVLSCLRARRPDAHLVVLSRNAEHTLAHHPDADEVVPWEGVSRNHVLDVLPGLELLVLGGGGILYDGEARRYLRLVRAAQIRRVPTFAYAVGAGPLTDAEDRDAVRTVLAEMDDVVVRDEESRLVLEEVGLEREVTVTADPALLLAPEPFTEAMMREEGIPSGARLVGMSVREPGRAAEKLDEGDYHALLADVADFLVRRLDARVVFLPMERHDVRHAHAVLSHMTAPDQGRILHGDYSPGQVLGFMRHLDVAVGMRLHFVIFAALTGVPVLPLPYSGKVFDFARRLGAPALVGVAREQAGLLLAEVDRLWDEYPQRRADLGARVAELSASARETCERCGALLDRIGAARDTGGAAAPTARPAATSAATSAPEGTTSGGPAGGPRSGDRPSRDGPADGSPPDDGLTGDRPTADGPTNDDHADGGPSGDRPPADGDPAGDGLADNNPADGSPSDNNPADSSPTGDRLPAGSPTDGDPAGDGLAGDGPTACDPVDGRSCRGEPRPLSA